LRFIAVAGCAFLATGCALLGGDAPRNDAGASPEKRWFAAAANPHAVDAAAAVLERGGTAVDAAIAAQAVLTLVEPQSSGLAGGAFLLRYDPHTDNIDAYDGREIAPASATPERFLNPDGSPMGYDAVLSGLSTGVPGTVRMLALAHQEHGKTPWSELLAPALKLADEGFPVSPRLNKMISTARGLAEGSAASRAYFFDASGAAHPVGHVLKNPAYAETLRLLIKGGPEAFYKGPIADGILAAVNAPPRAGAMTQADFDAYRPVKRAPVCGPYRDLTICSMGPPSSGGVALLQMLGMLEGFDLEGAGAGSIEATHLMLEANRIAFADRARYLADLDGRDDPSAEELVAGLLNPDYVRSRAALIDPARAGAKVDAGDPTKFPITCNCDPGVWNPLSKDASPELPSTSHLIMIDGEGVVVSMTMTVEAEFGNRRMAGGMMLNNELTDFSFIPVADGRPVANAVGPRKRPRSSMTPAIIFDDEGKVWGAAGSAGGAAIIGYVMKTVVAMIDWNMDPAAAVAAPNIVYPRGEPVLEAGGFDPQIIDGLKRRGHNIVEMELTSGTQAMRVMHDGTVLGGGDPRREGTWKTGTVRDVH
jgi:gamma-glutamyltranspeptidase/glutathione hydrolase